MNFNKAIEILGLSSKHYTEKELKRAYYKNAIKWHPDKNGGSEEAEEKFKTWNWSWHRTIFSYYWTTNNGGCC